MPSDPLLPRKENLQILPPSPPTICARWPSTGYAHVTVVGSQVSPNSKRPRFERRPQQDVRIYASPSSRGRRRWIQGHQRRPSPSSPNGRRGDVLLVHTKCAVHTKLLANDFLLFSMAASSARHRCLRPCCANKCSKKREIERQMATAKLFAEEQLAEDVALKRGIFVGAGCFAEKKIPIMEIHGAKCYLIYQLPSLGFFLLATCNESVVSTFCWFIQGRRKDINIIKKAFISYQLLASASTMHISLSAEFDYSVGPTIARGRISIFDGVQKSLPVVSPILLFTILIFTILIRMWPPMATIEFLTSHLSGLNQQSYLSYQASSDPQQYKDQSQKSVQGTQAVLDPYSLLGLLSLIGMKEPGPTTLALGIDLTSLGLNLNSQDNLYKTFGSPWSSEPAVGEPDYQIPACFSTKPPPALQKFHPLTLFYIFYSMPKDATQLYAANELLLDWTPLCSSDDQSVNHKFKPYKSNSYAGETATSKKKRRTPAWCERILWHGDGIAQLSYFRGGSQFSDHRRVCRTFTVEMDEIVDKAISIMQVTSKHLMYIRKEKLHPGKALSAIEVKELREALEAIAEGCKDSWE
ncbi:putative NOT transcription complex subunit VIP2 [Zea mays]|uniref:Putative NOT transcription complex subunit VIP2 n=1 Tax=Zea mays TaxID=4577 RepID=A0A3L6E7N6_MAIZE|nr:putative NOT transcription complex subunit VIP2 [Zea mays]